jgi:hypothetical protein
MGSSAVLDRDFLSCSCRLFRPMCSTTASWSRREVAGAALAACVTGLGNGPYPVIGTESLPLRLTQAATAGALGLASARAARFTFDCQRARGDPHRPIAFDDEALRRLVVA